ncbi:MAG: hypothetical protein JWM73_2811 [Solirubrobacterales bacterium]|jgi:hypothetical protein|nr:hypothetical protein [Solirubrobacterales bacterium]
MTKPRTRLLAAAATCAAIALPAFAAAPASAATCGGLPSYPSSKGGYYTSLKVSGISCSGGKAVMKGHYRCRTQHGIRGKCPSFNGWHCTEKRQSISTEYNARVTCKKGSRTVTYTYQQNT